MPDNTQADRSDVAKKGTEITDLPDREKHLDMKVAENVKGGAVPEKLPGRSIGVSD